MKAIVVTGTGQADVVDLERPTIGPGEVLVKSRAVAICGSDVTLYQGTRPAGFYRYPVIPGHEWSGEIVMVGDLVQWLHPGQKVVVESIVSCGVCRNCRNGATNLCERGYDEFGFTRPGGLAEYVVVPARLVHVLPDDAAFEEAALLEPAAAVVQAFEQVQPLPGDVITVVGDGVISLIVVQMARLFSPAALVVVGLRQGNLTLARQLGATHTIHIGREDPQDILRELSMGRGADLVFEGSGSPDAMIEAMLLARRGGSVLLEGAPGERGMLHVESDIFTLKHLAIYGILNANSAAWTYAVSLFRRKQFHLAPLISHRFAVEEYQDAIDTLRIGQAVKVVMTHTE